MKKVYGLSQVDPHSKLIPLEYLHEDILSNNERVARIARLYYANHYATNYERKVIKRRERRELTLVLMSITTIGTALIFIAIRRLFGI